MIYAVVLAAGLSRRMGSQKLLLPYNGRPLVMHIVQQLQKSKIDGIIVVTGYMANEIMRVLPQSACKFVNNEHYQEGMLSSVRAGLRAVPLEAEAFMVVLGDQPSLRTPVVNQLIDGYRATSKSIVVPAHRNDTGHPIVISTSHRDAILTEFNETGLRGLIYGNPDQVYRLPVEDEGVLRDMDTPEDYRRELAALSL
ncbi:MAG: hypothetical protein AMXMBFR84_22780 [Candidatus Hydrogenedentota bacterium]